MRIFVLFIVLTSCTYYIEQQGVVLDEDIIKDFQLETDSVTTVKAKLGEPSFKSTNNPNVWYYVSQKTMRGAFQESKVVDHKVLILAFDKADGSLQALSRKGMENYNPITPVLKTTATAQKDYSLIEELLGSVIHRAKKFSKQQKQ